MKQSWDIFQQKVKELKMVVEDLSAIMPSSKKYIKLRTSLEAAWKEMQRAGDKVDGFISEKINPLTIDPPWDHPKFWAKWQFFKDYLFEQWGFTMMTRMEAVCLENLKEWTNNDPEKAIRWIDYYITNKYNKIFKVKEDETNGQQSENGQQKTETGKNIIRGVKRELREDSTTGS